MWKVALPLVLTALAMMFLGRALEAPISETRLGAAIQLLTGAPAPLEGQELAWVRPARLTDYPMPPADQPLVALLRDLL